MHVWEDATRTILASNDSPDVGFSYSVNPYRGCMHACAYCYARPGHEYLGFGAGTDFDTQVVVKRRAPELLREAFYKPSWKGDLVVFSGVTDCYQPLEASLRLTRGCLEVCAEFRNPVGVITKSPIIERDIDVLQQLAARGEPERGGEHSLPRSRRSPGPSSPGWPRRGDGSRSSSGSAGAGLRVGVNIAPIIPGLDEGVSRVLADAAQAGAHFAGYVLLRLPGPVRAGLRAAAPGSPSPPGREGAPPHPGDAGREDVRPALAPPTARRGSVRRGGGGALQRTGPQGGTRSAMEEEERPPTFRRPPRPGDQLGLL